MLLRWYTDRPWQDGGLSAFFVPLWRIYIFKIIAESKSLLIILVDYNIPLMSDQIHITLPDGSVKEMKQGVTPLDIANSISERLAQEVLAAECDGELIDVRTPLMHDAHIKLLKWEDEGGKHAFWHTSAHLMAEALQELYPGVQFGIGPAIEAGFYYDIDAGDEVIKSEDLPKIEAKMLELARRKETLERKAISKSIRRVPSRTSVVDHTSPPQRLSRRSNY